MTAVDLIIIGGGAAGFAAAIRADELGARTAMINDGLPLGGTCVNVGCVPSKHLLHAARTLHRTVGNDVAGVHVTVGDIDFKAAIEDEQRLVARMRAEKYEAVADRLAMLELINGRARFISRDTIRVNGRILQAPKIIIATGSSARAVPIAGIEKTGFVTHIEALNIKDRPAQLTVIGAGAVAVEMAQMFARFGTQVTILRRRDGLVPHAEAELARQLENLLVAEGIGFVTYDRIRSAQRIGNRKRLHLTTDGAPMTVDGDAILMAAGKTPNTGDLDLAAAGVNTNDSGAVIVNRFLQTDNADIYAAGDVAHRPLRLEPAAGREGTLAASHALTDMADPIDFKAVPFTVFTDPQLAGVGLTEAAQHRQTGRCWCRTLPMGTNARAVIEKRTEGLIKMVADPDTEQVLGVHILAPAAGEMIAAAMWIVAGGHTLDEIIASMPMFPTWSEAIKTVALSFKTDVARLSCCV